MKQKGMVRNVIFDTVKKQKWLSLGIVVAVVGAVVATLIPPLILAKIVDTITAGTGVSVPFIVLYFLMLALTGFLESAREGLLTVFGQKITHALRSRLMEKFVNLTADSINQQEPGTLVSRFVGDVDTVENLFTSGIISMFADACKIVSILVVIWFQNCGLTLVLLVILPFLFGFTRHVQKNMLAAQIANRKAVGRASAHVPETLHNIRTIHCLGKENYMEERYDQYIGESYQAMERTNFYDAVYSPVILILNAIVVAVVMLLSASGNPEVLAFFGMSAGTAVAVINYISQIFGPVESLGMEIQTIQSALAGIHRINEFFELEEKEPLEEKEQKMQAEKRRKEQLTYDYAEVISKLVLLAGAGMTIRRAWEKIAGDYQKKPCGGKRYVYEEMVRTCAEMNTGVPERSAYERFARRCDTKEYLKLASLLSQNVKKGTTDILKLLEQESQSAFEQHKNLAKKKGEEAGTKLLFPMILMLMTVMAMLMFPAIVSFQTF